jgi:hypothetical protein
VVSTTGIHRSPARETMTILMGIIRLPTPTTATTTALMISRIIHRIADLPTFRTILATTLTTANPVTILPTVTRTLATTHPTTISLRIVLITITTLKDQATTGIITLHKTITTALVPTIRT